MAKKKKVSDDNSYQSVVITLTNGKEGIFIGPVLVTDEDRLKGHTIKDIRFTYPKELPEGAYFGKLDDVNKS